MEGVPSDFSAVLLDRSCSSLQSVLGPLLGVPVEIVSVGTAPVESPIDLLPAPWIHERRRLRRTERLRARMIKGGAGVLGLLVLAIGYLVWLQFRVNALNRELERLRPELTTVQRRQERWSAVSPAFDPGRYPVEILYQVYQSLPSDEVRITQFSQQLDSFTVEGEAPSASQAIQFADSLRENPALEEYTVEAGPPEILPNDHAQFRVFAKR
jgi:Tfp pilus assembly protein PilN